MKLQKLIISTLTLFTYTLATPTTNNINPKEVFPTILSSQTSIELKKPILVEKIDFLQSREVINEENCFLKKKKEKENKKDKKDTLCKYNSNAIATLLQFQFFPTENQQTLQIANKSKTFKQSHVPSLVISVSKSNLVFKAPKNRDGKRVQHIGTITDTANISTYTFHSGDYYIESLNIQSDDPKKSDLFTLETKGEVRIFLNSDSKIIKRAEKYKKRGYIELNYKNKSSDYLIIFAKSNLTIDASRRLKMRGFIYGYEDITLMANNNSTYQGAVTAQGTLTVGKEEAKHHKQEKVGTFIYDDKRVKKLNLKYEFEDIALNGDANITIDDLLSDINSSKNIKPKVLVDTIKAYYAQFDANVNVAITLQLVPVFHLLHNNYDYYKDVILDMYSDKNNHRLLRLPMLNIIEYHLDDTASLDAVKAVFADKSDDSLIVGQSAELLAQKRVDISQEVERRYPNSDDVSKPYYARILALFRPNSSREMIERDMDSEMEGNKKIKLISAFAKTGIDDDYVINKLMDLLYVTIPNSHFHPTEKEIISVGITMDLANSTRDDRFMRLIDIASNSMFSEGTRANALIHLYFQLESNTTVDKSAIKVRLQQLSQDILSSNQLEEHEKSFLNENVVQILDILKRF